MDTPTPSAPISKPVVWTSRVLSTLPVLLLLFSASLKLLKVAGLADGFGHLGMPLNLAFGLGVLELACTVIYVLPATAVLGAVLLTGYFGGAIAIHLRVGDPFYMQIILGVALWGGLYLREPRLRPLLPLRRA